MLPSSSRLWSQLASALERQASCQTCSTSGSGYSFWATSGQRRLAGSQSRSRGDRPDAPSSASAATSADGDSKASTPQQPSAPEPPTAPLQAPTSSPAVQALSEKLRQSSPTGRLIDLFAPEGRPRGPGQRASGALPFPAAATTAEEAAADAAAAGDTDVTRVVMRAVENCKPLMSVMQSKVGERVVPIPRPLQPAQSMQFAVKWILQAAEKRREASRGKASIADCLATELLLAYQRKGSARAKRDELHKMALDSRPNLRGRW